MEQETRQFKCTGDCLKCQPVQRQYCAAQKGYDNQKLLLALQESISVMNGNVKKLKEKITAIQDNEALVFNPEEKSEIPTLSTQEGDGV